MFEEGQLYSPVTHDEDGKAVVHLGEDHPGFNDPAYRERRNEIATAATLAGRPGEPIPHIDYTDAENEIWRTVCRELRDEARARTPAASSSRRRPRSACPRTASRSSTRSPRACSR